MPSQLTLFIPGLLHPPQPIQGLSAEDKPAFNTLNFFFNRAKRSEYPVKGYYISLFHEFGITTHDDKDPPVAAITHRVDSGEQTADWVLRCDPACIHADMDRAVLMGHGELGLTPDETEQLVMIINAHVEQDGWQIEAHGVDRWYVKGLDKNRIQTTTPHEILGEDIKHALPRGEDGSYWCSIMNECQMLLHDLPVNLERQSRGLLPVNSLWFWGAGRLPEKAACHYDRLVADDILVEGLAMLAGCEYVPFDDRMGLQGHTGQHALLVWDRLVSPRVKQDLFAWLDEVQWFEKNILLKIIGLLKSRQLEQVKLITTEGHSFELNRSRFRHWWKRGHGYDALLNEKKQ